MKMNWVALTVTAIVTTLIIFIGVASGFFVPNPNLPSDNLLAEVTLPLIAASLFSLIAGYIASQQAGSLRSGALGGAVNSLINVGLLLLLLSILDRHFISIGGRSLVAWLPLVALIGSLLGMVGAGVRNLVGKSNKTWSN